MNPPTPLTGLGARQAPFRSITESAGLTGAQAAQNADSMRRPTIADSLPKAATGANVEALRTDLAAALEVALHLAASINACQSAFDRLAARHAQHEQGATSDGLESHTP